MAVTTTVYIDDAAVAGMTSWNSEFGRSFTKLARAIEHLAKFHVPQEYSKVGRLRESINHNAGSQRNARGIWFEVGSKVGYSLFVESGTSPHHIAPKQPKGMLVFFWRRVGSTVFMRGVKHPGNKAYRYLETGMIQGVEIWQRTG